MGNVIFQSVTSSRGPCLILKQHLVHDSVEHGSDKGRNPCVYSDPVFIYVKQRDQELI